METLLQYSLRQKKLTYLQAVLA